MLLQNEDQWKRFEKYLLGPGLLGHRSVLNENGNDVRG